MSLEERYQAAGETLRTLKSKFSEEHVLKSYGLYKQAEHGDNNTDLADQLDERSKKKWQAWEANRGLSSEKAKEELIQFKDEIEFEYA